MTLSLLALALSVASADVPAAPLLQPGVYVLQADATWPAAPEDAPSGQAYEWRDVHALPTAARVRVAYVALDARAGLNRLVFATDPGYRYDINSANTLCPAYAFPGWNFRSEAMPFCRTNIANDGREAMLDGEARAFTLRWPEQKTFLRTEKIPARRKPTPEEVGACAISDVCEPDAYGRSIQHYAMTRARDRFVLQQARPFVDMLYLPRAIALHRAADAHSAASALPADSFVAVLGRTAAWYEVEPVVAGGHAQTGWIDRDVLVPLHWVDQQARLPGVGFRLGYAPAGGDDGDGPVQIAAIEIRDADSGQRRQVLRDFDSDPVGEDREVLQLIDVDGDGHADIVVPGVAGDPGDGQGQLVFRFDPRTRRFAEVPDAAP
ncbi:hypothetical protein [Stenotrophomonas sp.]|uniref:hypothetical protein n=1 Tax=Stenotrophomonas sp. TaxID=69392 RepID=UPI002FCC7CD6